MIMSERVFISYKRVDKDRVFAIKDFIEEHSGLECWIDIEGIESDAQFANVIIGAINRCKVFLFMYSSAHSAIVNFDKDWTVREINFAEKKNKRIVFVNIDNSVLSDWFELIFGTKQQIDGTSTDSLLRLCKDLRKWFGKDETRGSNVSDGSGKSFFGLINGYEYVDLGLPSGLKWATCNVGAETPEDYGDYYAWGETITKSEYTEENSLTYGESISNISGDSTSDVARKKWGSSWRIPTRSEFEELIDNCEWTWTTQNGKRGYKVIGPNGNSIFLTAAGFRRGSSLSFAGEYGSYWSSTPDATSGARRLYFDWSYHDTLWCSRYFGQSVRPVSE